MEVAEVANDITVPTQRFVNPLNVDNTVQRIDEVINGLVEEVVTGITDEMQAKVKQKIVTVAIRNVLTVRAFLTNLVRDHLGFPDLTRMTIDGHRTNLIGYFKLVNPQATEQQIETIVDTFLDDLKAQITPPTAEVTEPKKPKKKS